MTIITIALTVILGALPILIIGAMQRINGEWL
jgi:hypothetical protein